MTFLLEWGGCLPRVLEKLVSIQPLQEAVILIPCVLGIRTGDLSVSRPTPYPLGHRTHNVGRVNVDRLFEVRFYALQNSKKKGKEVKGILCNFYSKNKSIHIHIYFAFLPVYQTL